MKLTNILAVVAAMLSLTLIAAADDYAEKARPIFNKHKEAVVTVQLVLKNKLSMPGSETRSSESRQEITGTVIDRSGLTVVSLSSIDPGQMVQNLMAGDRLRMESELADLKILLSNGEEVPCEVVLRDKDFDLAFIRPKSKPEQAMAYVDMRQSGKAEIAEPLVVLNRLGNAAGRSHSIAAERISAIVRRPRLFYIPDANMTTSSLGCPAFTQDGKVLGVMLLRAVRSGVGSSSFNTQNPNYTGIILPAADIMKVADQVPEHGEASAK